MWNNHCRGITKGGGNKRVRKLNPLRKIITRRGHIKREVREIQEEITVTVVKGSGHWITLAAKRR